MKRTLLIGGILVGIVLLLALPKLDLFSNGKSTGASERGSGQAKLMAEAVVVKPSHLDNKLVVTGSVLANESLELHSETSGKITKIFFKEGTRVKKGDVLLQINDDEIRAQLQKQKYIRKLNEDNEFRQRRLLEKDAISQEEYENALNNVNTTLADIQLLEAQLEKTKILAPFDGVIGLRYVSEGAYITPSTNIATLYSLTPAKIEFAVPGRHSDKVKPGKKIFFTIESSENTFSGLVYAVEPQIDQNTRTLEVRALADNSEGALLPGQFVKVELILESADDALLVPTESLVPEMEGHKAYVSKNGKAAEVHVKIGIRTDRNVEIVSGLNEGDTVLTTGLLQVKDGVPLDLQIINQDYGESLNSQY